IGANNATYIETSQPAYVWQLSGSGCEFGSALLPQIECTGSNSVSYTRSSNFQLYVNVLVPDGGQANFLVNNNSNVITAAQFTVVPGTAGAWRYARVLLPLAQYPQNGLINITNSVSRF